MILAARILTGMFVSLPAILVYAYAIRFIGDEYFRLTYLIVCAVFLVASFVSGFVLSPRTREVRFRQAWTWLFV